MRVEKEELAKSYRHQAQISLEPTGLALTPSHLGLQAPLTGATDRVQQSDVLLAPHQLFDRARSGRGIGMKEPFFGLCNALQRRLKPSLRDRAVFDCLMDGLHRGHLAVTIFADQQDVSTGE